MSCTSASYDVISQTSWLCRNQHAMMRGVYINRKGAFCFNSRLHMHMTDLKSRSKLLQLVYLRRWWLKWFVEFRNKSIISVQTFPKQYFVLFEIYQATGPQWNLTTCLNSAFQSGKCCFQYQKVSGFSQRLGGSKKNTPPFTLHPSDCRKRWPDSPSWTRRKQRPVLLRNHRRRDDFPWCNRNPSRTPKRSHCQKRRCRSWSWMPKVDYGNLKLSKRICKPLESKGKWNTVYNLKMAVGSLDGIFLGGGWCMFLVVDCLGGRIGLMIGNTSICIILDVKSEIFWSSSKAAASLNKNPENFPDFEACKIQKRDMQLFLSQMSDQPKPQASVQSSGPKGDGRKWDRTASKSSDSTEGGVWWKWHEQKIPPDLGLFLIYQY